jgi:hypothetical protein
MGWNFCSAPSVVFLIFTRVKSLTDFPAKKINIDGLGMAQGGDGVNETLGPVLRHYQALRVSK